MSWTIFLLGFLFLLSATPQQMALATASSFGLEEEDLTSSRQTTTTTTLSSSSSLSSSAAPSTTVLRGGRHFQEEEEEQHQHQHQQEIAVRRRLDEDEYAKEFPYIVWLLSYPNSGTTFTHQMYEAITDGTAATNYGNECVLNERNPECVPVHPNHPEGPYFHYGDRDMSAQTHVLTKTHCGGFCIWCSPDGYTEQGREFVESCTRGYHVVDTATLRGENSFYDHGRVRKVVHLVRDPLDNMVARYHYQRKFLVKDANDQAQFPKTAEGFRTWCIRLNQQDEEYRHSWPQHPIFTKISPQVPCRSELFRYLQWHNNAYDVAHALDLPEMILNYERYDTDKEGAAYDLRQFLQVEGHGRELPEYLSGKTYHSYFTDDERAAILQAILQVATAKTWSRIAHYFPEMQSQNQ